MATELAGSPTVVRQRPAPGADPCAGCPLVTVMVCRKCKGSDKVVEFLTSQTRARVRTVRCQKVCKGPVAGLAIRGRMEWFGRLKGPKQLEALKRLVATGRPAKIPKTLRKRLSEDRSGCRPR